jgi:amino acid adenylation domain-containing protein
MKEYVDSTENNRQVIDDTKTDTIEPLAFIPKVDNIISINIPCERELRNSITQLAIKQNTTPFVIQCAVFQVLLYRYNKQEDFKAIDTESDTFQTEGLIQQYTGETTFSDLVQATKNTLSDSACIISPEIGSVHARCSQFTDNRVNTSSISISLVAGEPETVICFNNQLYTEAEADRMVAHYVQLLHSAVEQPQQKIGALPMLTASEMHQLFNVFNGTLQPYEESKTIVDIFEEQVARTPGNIALYLGETSMTYTELNARANQLARHLVQQGVKLQDNVALLTSRHFDMIIGLLAILKAGAAYVPIPTEYPSDRQQYMIAKSDVKYILYNIDPLYTLGEGVQGVDMRAIDIDNYSESNLNRPIDSRQLAYTIYTSGSTGQPKGVMIEHHSVINLVNWVNTTYNIGSDDRLLFITSVGFDLSVYDIFGILAAGGAVVFAGREDILSTAKLADIMQRYRITFWDSVPTTMDYLVNNIANNNSSYIQDSLRVVFLSGDWIPVTLPDKIRKFFPNANVISLGGATEGTIWSNYFPVEQVLPEWRSIPYGRPITNNAFYILNDQLQPAPVGVAGELYIGGVGVARGYANDPGKTAASFVEDPFTKQWGGRMYKTGDLGRMLPEGIMEFIGRKDNQVKVRGHRVELGEVESVIRQNKTISHAAVLLSRDKKQLIGFIVPGKYYDRDTMIAGLRKKLPDYMVPGKWVELEAMPLTSNGKTDVKALQNMLMPEKVRREYIAPRNECEKTMAAVWEQVLGVEQVGINDNFFDMGGQSLMAVELITELEKKVGKELPVNIIYKYPTIAELYNFLQEEKASKKWKSLVAIKATGKKTPVYLVHGDGLSLSNFENLAEHVDADQPVFSLQPVGLNGADQPFESIADIAKHYLTEILEHNADGPYALGGYSFGGYVAIEMKKQLEAMGKQVKMLALFDTNAENVIYQKDLSRSLSRRIKRQFPKFLFIARSAITRPQATFKYQCFVLSQKINNLCYKLGVKQRPELTGVNKYISRINEHHLKALRNYELTPFNDKVYLFKAKMRLYFVDDFKYLGWGTYAQQGVKVYDVPGDHKTMFHPPHVSVLGKHLQHALDNS